MAFLTRKVSARYRLRPSFKIRRLKLAMPSRKELISLAIVLAVAGGITYGQIKDNHTVEAAPQRQTVQQSKVDKAVTPAPVNLDSFSTVIANTRGSVVKFQSEACGYIISGTGFVVAPDLVLTNAHVVAGITDPTIIDNNGYHTGTTVFFDPNLDIAIVRVTNLAGSPLPLNIPKVGLNIQGSHNNDHAVILGYPGGNDFQSVLTTIGKEYSALVYDIYHEKIGSERDLFHLDTQIAPGTSGSPIVLLDGRVIGIVFAADPVDQLKGIALPTVDFYDFVQQAKNLTASVDTQKCAIN